ncbi:MAG: hypothetical protein KAI24_14870 [Planctomycetes bacterium]|nr:hypothetical protein [Planctomycetota bacterium]
MPFLRHLPTLGIAAATSLGILAASRYPGGTHADPATAGYRWAENFVCTLFAPEAFNGEPNAARAPAIAALLLLCASLALLFFMISRSTSSRRHRSTIEISGIGTAVYTALVATPMHDLMVTIGLGFGLVAFLSVAHLMLRERRAGLVLWGGAVVTLKLASAVSYYGDVMFEWLPLLQKVGIATVLGWLLAVHYRNPQ